MLYYEHGGGNNCIIGGYVYRGNKYPSLEGKYIFGDYGGRNIWSVNLDGSEQTLLYTLGDRFPTFAQDAEGEIYIGKMGTASLLQLTTVEEPEIPDGFYYLRSRHSGKVMQVEAQSTANGGDVEQWTQENTPHQQWFIEKLADGNYRIKNENSGLYMEASAFGTNNGTNAQQWTWTGTNSQRWTIEKGDEEYFFIRNLHNNLYADVAAYSTTNGGTIHLWSLHGGPNQQWELIPVDGPAITPPKFLSETGVFSDLANLVPAQGVIPYTVNSSLWSDGSEKMRWVAVPNDGVFDLLSEKITLDRLGEWDFDHRGEWEFPVGTVFIKHFEIALNENNPGQRKKLETRFIVLRGNNNFYGVTYKWNPEGTDAELLYEGLSETLSISQMDGSTRTQTWRYPSRSECLSCHTQASGGVLGPQFSQLNGDLAYPGTGITSNQLETWNHLGMFDRNLNVSAIQKLITSYEIDNQSASLEQRARSYLDANCSSCHRPNGGPRAEFDARIETSLDEQNIIEGPVIETMGIPNARLIVPGNPAASIIYQRINQANTPDAMPPLAKNRVDQEGVALIEAWINQLPANGGGWNATYFADRTFSSLAFSRVDRAIDFKWDTEAPNEGFPRTNFTVRWEGTLETRFDELYTFSLLADDGVRMWVDGQLVIDDWRVKAPSETRGQIQLSEGDHEVKVEYFQAGGHARVHLFWESPSQARELVPAMHVQPSYEDTEAPSIPLNVSAFNVGQTELDLSWDASTDNEGVVGYYVYQDGNPTPIATISGTNLNVTGLTPNTSYQFTVAAYDAEGNVSAQSQPIQVTTTANQPPVASLSATPTSGEAPLAVNFVGTASADPDGSIVSYSWNFGDGDTGNGATTSHTYTAAGNYTASLTVFDEDGATSVDNIVITVSQPPTGPLCFQVASGTVVIEAENYSAATPGTGAQSAFTWESYSDPQASGGTAMRVPNGSGGGWTGLDLTGPRLDYDINFPQAGTYRLWVRTSAASGNDDSFHAGLDGVGYTNSTGVGMGNIVGSWGWTNDANSGQAVEIVVNTAGLHTLNIWMREDGVQVDKILLGINATAPQGTSGRKKVPQGPCEGIPNQPPVANFTADPEAGALPLTVSFDATSSFDTDGSIVTYNWDFGDGNNGNGATSSHTYTEEGIFTARLTVTDNEGLTGTTETNISVVPDAGNGLCFVESNGELVMEAEDFSASQPGLDGLEPFYWEEYEDLNASGGKAVRAVPNTVGGWSGLNLNGPRLDFEVNFTNPGLYYLWVRTSAPSGQDDSFHAGMDGTAYTNLSGLGMGINGDWGWTNDANNGQSVQIPINAIGKHTFNIWMRENGVQIDKIVLKTDPSQPLGMGPSVSAMANCATNQASPLQNPGSSRQDFTVDTRSTEQKDFELLVYPNPFEREFFFEIQSREQRFKQIHIRLLDLMGREVYAEQEVRPNTRVQLGAQLAKGVYILRVIADGQPYDIKLDKF